MQTIFRVVQIVVFALTWLSGRANQAATPAAPTL